MHEIYTVPRLDMATLFDFRGGRGRWRHAEGPHCDAAWREAQKEGLLNNDGTYTFTNGVTIVARATLRTFLLIGHPFISFRSRVAKF